MRGPVATGFVSSPEPRTIGRFAKGRQLLAGNLLFAGTLIEAPGRDPWQIEAPPAFIAELQGCVWLDDLAAVGDAKARALAQDWVFSWIARHGRGDGPGWTPELTGRRLIRWINHALFLLRGKDRAASGAFYDSLTRQTRLLSKSWQKSAPGLPRFEALTGLIHAGLSLKGLEPLAAPAISALAEACRSAVTLGGGIDSRNPEELLEIFTLLTWAAQTLSEAELLPPPDIADAIARIAPVLRALRHADGALTRFHGGGRGLEGRLDQALAASGVRGRHPGGLAMGFARLTAGRSSVICDAAPPPSGTAATEAHASTLAFELTSGRRPIIVNCGSGRNFGPEWRRAGRATPSHSTLGIEGWSSARLVARGGREAGREFLTDAPGEVRGEVTDHGDHIRLESSHNGWQRSHGLTHARMLDLSIDGRSLFGEDLLTTLTTADRLRFDRAMDETALQGLPVSLRFHLHPDVSAEIDMGGAAVSLVLKSGEIWLFRHSGDAELRLEPTVYLDSTRLKPRTSQQVVLSGRVMAYATRIRWSVSKAQDTPEGLRDYGPAETEEEDP